MFHGNRLQKKKKKRMKEKKTEGERKTERTSGLGLQMREAFSGKDRHLVELQPRCPWACPARGPEGGEGAGLRASKQNKKQGNKCWCISRFYILAAQEPYLLAFGHCAPETLTCVNRAAAASQLQVSAVYGAKPSHSPCEQMKETKASCDKMNNKYKR